MFFVNRSTNFNIVTNPQPGTALTPGASGAWGSWTTLIAGASNTRGGEWHRTHVVTNYAASTDRRLFIDLGYRVAGSSGSEITAVPRLVGSKAPDNQVYNSMGLEYEGPIYVPAGYDLVARGMSNQASPTTCYIVSTLYADALYEYPQASMCEAIGFNDTTVQGVDVACFNNGFHVTAGYGSTWTSLGTISRESKWLDASLVKYGTNDGTAYHAMQIAYGDATNKVIVMGDAVWGYAVGEAFQKRKFERYIDRIPAGSTLYARVVSQTDGNVAVIAYNYF